MNKRTIANALVCSALALGATSGAWGFTETLVQFSPTGSGKTSGYEMSGIYLFDWQASGDLVIKNALPGGGTLGAWLAAGVVGSRATYDWAAQARLNDMINTDGDSVLGTDPTFSADGTCAGAGCWEITGVLKGQTTAEIVANGPLGNVLSFISLNSGSFEFLIDGSPDSDVETGAGFADGTRFAWGTLSQVTGTFDYATSNGSNLLEADITGYDTAYIRSDPAVYDWILNGILFDAEIKFGTPDLARLNSDGTIGPDLYVPQLGDVFLKADASSPFSVPEPGSLLLCGIGMLSLAAMRRAWRRV